MTTILIGVDDSPRSEDAVAFARRSRRASGADRRARVRVPVRRHAEPCQQPRVPRDREEPRRSGRCAAAAARLEGVDPRRVKTRAVASTSPARALDRLAESERAELIVVGSTHTGRLGRIVPGSTAERLLHGAPCPVAVVPHGFRERTPGRPMQIGVAYDGSAGEPGRAARGGIASPRALGGDLRVIGVLDAISYAAPALMGGPGYTEVRETIEDRGAETRCESTVAGLPEDVHAEPVFAAGDVVRELATQSKGLDLLVAGSRGYGPARGVLLGGVTGPADPRRGVPADHRPARARDAAEPAVRRGGLAYGPAMSRESSPHVVVAGGGVAAVETILALRALAGSRPRLTLLAPEPVLEHRPASVARRSGSARPPGCRWRA